MAMNIVEQRYDFLVDIKSLPRLNDAMLERSLKKLHKHKGWLYNYLYGTIDLQLFSPKQQAILNDCAIKFYGKPAL